MREETELRLMALEMVVGELVRRLSPAGFRESTMATMDRCVGRLAELSADEREDFGVFRRHVHEILYGKAPATAGACPSEPATPPAWKAPVLEAVGKTAGRR